MNKFKLATGEILHSALDFETLAFSGVLKPYVPPEVKAVDEAFALAMDECYWQLALDFADWLAVYRANKQVATPHAIVNDGSTWNAKEDLLRRAWMLYYHVEPTLDSLDTTKLHRACYEMLGSDSRKVLKLTYNWSGSNYPWPDCPEEQAEIKAAAEARIKLVEKARAEQAALQALKDQLANMGPPKSRKP